MSLIDLLRMSSGNLKRRKLRTFLTVLGVVIGTASIVVMISLGLGMQKSMYKQVEESGGITNIDVTGKKLSELKFAHGVLIDAIIRNGKAIVPTGEDKLAIGDKIVVVTLLQNVTHIYDLLKR